MSKASEAGTTLLREEEEEVEEAEEVDDIAGHGCDDIPKTELTLTEGEEDEEDGRGDAKDGRDGAVGRTVGLAIAILQDWTAEGETEEEAMPRISLLLLVDTALLTREVGAVEEDMENKGRSLLQYIINIPWR